jgi:hypothetical protein
MNWLAWFLVVWSAILAGVALFVIVDARNAFDADETTMTLSGYIKRWRRLRRYRTWLLGSWICLLVLVPVYLFAHLVLEVL